jgi:hypothetical protein
VRIYLPIYVSSLTALTKFGDLYSAYNTKFFLFNNSVMLVENSVGSLFICHINVRIVTCLVTIDGVLDCQLDLLDTLTVTLNYSVYTL